MRDKLVYHKAVFDHNNLKPSFNSSNKRYHLKITVFYTFAQGFLIVQSLKEMILYLLLLISL